METPIVLPELNVTDEPIHISTWLVSPDEPVEFGDRVVEVLIQGITFDVSSPAAGVMGRIEKSIDAVVVRGEILGWIQSPVVNDVRTEFDS